MHIPFTGARRAAAVLLLVTVRVGLAAEPVLPPLATQPSDQLADQAAVRVDRIDFSGNTVFADRQLLSAPVAWDTQNGKTRVTRRVRDYLGHDLTLDDLEQIRLAVTLYYVNGGSDDPAAEGSRYVNSGAVLPDQTVGPDHAVKIQVVEGKLGRVTVSPMKHLRQTFVERRVRRAAEPIFDRDKLQAALEVLRQNPNVERINANVTPGASTGQAELDVSIAERKPWESSLVGAEILKRTTRDLSPVDQFQVALQFDNHRSPSVGAERFSLNIENDDLLGFGDVLQVRYGINQGSLGDFQFAGVDDVSVDYSVPLAANDLRLETGFLRSDSPIVEEPYNSLDINSETERYYANLRLPLVRTALDDLSVFAGVQYQESLTTLGGERFSLTPGARNGESNVASLRFGGEVQTRDADQALSLRSTLAVGVDALDATVNGGSLADGQFVALLSQAQYVRRLGKAGTQLIARLDLQITPDSLPAVEQFSLGGAGTVRGYRENELVRDNALAASIELRHPLINRPDNGPAFLTGAVFFDNGYARNRNDQPQGEWLGSVGVGLLANPYHGVSGDLYYGYRLNHLDEQSGNLQDAGITFSVTFQLF